jgi:hypothetical protein
MNCTAEQRDKVAHQQPWMALFGIVNNHRSHGGEKCVEREDAR